VGAEAPRIGKSRQPLREAIKWKAQGGVCRERMVDGSPVRQGLNLEGRFVIGFVGTFKRWHGVDLLLSAFRELHRADPSIHLLLVGDGPLRSQFEKEVQNAGLIQAVTFAGALGHEDVPSMWPRCFPARQLQVSVRYHF